MGYDAVSGGADAGQPGPHHRVDCDGALDTEPGPGGDVQHQDDLVVTVCDMAREELGRQAAVHWSVPDPVPAGDPASFDAAVADLSRRVQRLAPHLEAIF